MEADLVSYAQEALAARRNEILAQRSSDATVVSIEDRMTSFDVVAARQTFAYMRDGFKELSQEFGPFLRCGGGDDMDSSSSNAESEHSEDSSLMIMPDGTTSLSSSPRAGGEQSATAVSTEATPLLVV